MEKFKIKQIASDELWAAVREKTNKTIEDARHPDNEAVDKFATAMKQKMCISRDKGRSGWETASAETLSRMLIEHIVKGDPVDVANFCMMLYTKGRRINVASSQSYSVQ